MTDLDRAAQDYFDPPDLTPTCDICNEPEWHGQGEGSDWNGETGCHLSCEKQRADDDYAIEAYMERESERAMEEAAAGLPFGGSE